MLILLLLFTFLSPSFTSVDSFNFSFPSVDSESCTNGGNLICSGSATASNGTLNVTSDHQQQQPRDPPPTNQIGRVLYKYPVIGWPAYICTTFSIRILTDPNSEGAGDGMAFVLAQDAAPSPPNSFGSFLGIFDQSTQGVVHQLAIEFDTYKNEFDPDDNHIAIDTVSVQSPVAVKSLNSTGINLKSGRKITVRVEYDGWTKNLQIYVGYNGDPLVSFLNHTMKLQHTVPSSVYVGFTAATGTLSETHQVLAWNFTSIELPNKSLGTENNLVVKIAVAVIYGLLFLAILALPFVLRALRIRKEMLARKVDIEVMIAAANGPQLFSYKKLSKATRNFSKDNLLGTGGFGSVYKGVISKPPTTIAIKKINATSKQGEKEYLAEICTISRLRHKNLLQLQGIFWPKIWTDSAFGDFNWSFVFTKGAPNSEGFSARRRLALMGLRIRRLIWPVVISTKGAPNPEAFFGPKTTCADGAPNPETLIWPVVISTKGAPNLEAFFGPKMACANGAPNPETLIWPVVISTKGAPNPEAFSAQRRLAPMGLRIQRL
ncbi:hypothetical protein ACSBR2_036900 [Camellia fascicularis]